MKIFFNCFRKIESNRNIQKYLVIILVCMIFTLTVAYAALGAILEIEGTAEVVASSWDIKLENPMVKSGSVSGSTPTITSNTTAFFSTTLTNPGDFYEFSIDVVNNGSIDAMIDSVEKLPSLTSEQAKYLNYIIEYENGNAISTKQLVAKNSFVRLRVRIEYRKDVNSIDLPTGQTVLDLSFTVKYVQSDDSNNNVSIDNNGKLIKVVSGDGTKTSDEICIGEECFYVISSTDEEIKMLAKYNLLVGNKYDDTNETVPLENPTGVQDEIAKGWFIGYSVNNPIIGTKPFSSTNYWISTTSTYPAYVYNENSYLYEDVENYKNYLEGFVTKINEARLITMEELEGLGCSRSGSSCSGAPDWVYSTTYWTGTATHGYDVWRVISGSSNFDDNYYASYVYGIRPVIVIPRSLL